MILQDIEPLDPGPVAAPGRKTILVVEDDVSVREALAAVLEDEGYAVAQAGHGGEALDYLAGHPAPHLILLDLWMPVMTGEEFLVRQGADPALAAIPVVVVSATHDGLQRATALGARGYLAKPVRVEVLLQAIARVGG